MTTLNKRTPNKKTFKKMLKRTIMISVLVSSAIGLSACQSTTNLNLQPIENPQQFAKSTLNKAISQQATKSHAYKTSVVISNENRRKALAQASPLQRTMADSRFSHCDTMHDRAYVSLLDNATAHGREITDAIYSDKLEKIKQENINCEYHYQSWLDNNKNDDELFDYDEDYTEEDYTEDDFDSLDDDISDVNRAYYDDAASDINVDMDSNNDTTSMDSEYLAEGADGDGEYLPNYDNDHTELDAKKADLIDAYLLKPMTIEVQGVYQPRHGFMTVLPTVQYQTRNHTTAINQPIYLDAKQGNIYIWSGNLAYPTSILLDKHLGEQWHNKWLKIELKDGTLPDGFGRDLIKTHLQAIDTANANLSHEHYQLIDNAYLNQLSPSIDPEHLAKIDQASLLYVVSRELDEVAFEDYMADYTQTFYDTLSQKYPELIKTADSEVETDYSDGEPLITNKKVMTKLLSIMKNGLDNHNAKSNNNDSEHYQNNESVTDAQNEAQNDSRDNVIQSELVNYAQLKSDNPTQYKVVTEFFGLDNHQQIVWRLRRLQLSDKNDLDIETGEGLTVDSFTQYSDIDTASDYYPNLPSDLQTPNAQNSIDLKEYSRLLLKEYEQGEGTEIGKIAYTFYSMMKMATATTLVSGLISTE